MLRPQLRSLIQTCASIVLSSWIAAFLTGRVAVFHRFYSEHTAAYSEASFLLTEVCFNDTIKANLGSNGFVCEQAARSLAITPLLHAVYSTSEVTYLCGSNSCTNLFLNITASWSSFILTVVMTLAVSPVLYRKLLQWGYRRVHQRKRAQHALQTYKEPLWDDGRYLPMSYTAIPVHQDPILKEKAH